jgi:AbrB family looped-hinge helix DNA binding protein
MEKHMPTVKVSSKYQVVIPEKVRESLQLKPGQEVQVFEYQDRIEFVPVVSMTRLRGSLKGIDTSVERDGDRA